MQNLQIFPAALDRYLCPGGPIVSACRISTNPINPSSRPKSTGPAQLADSPGIPKCCEKFIRSITGRFSACCESLITSHGIPISPRHTALLMLYPYITSDAANACHGLAFNRGSSRREITNCPRGLHARCNNGPSELSA